ncbi:MAG TPA: hypothetical protein VNR61_19200 [Niallia sp.]|nr:hypothetical protein [Niallia sp.]
MNPFNDNVLKETFYSISNPITMNPNSDESYTINGFITNATLSPNSSYHLHSLDTFNRGDYFTIDGQSFYMVTGDVVMMRGSKYKSTADYCNSQIPIIETVREITGFDDFGRPIYGNVEKIVGNNYGIVRHKQLTVDDGSVLIVANSELVLTLRDNTQNRASYSVNSVIVYEGISWKVREIVYTKKGLLEYRLQSTT